MLSSAGAHKTLVALSTLLLVFQPFCEAPKWKSICAFWPTGQEVRNKVDSTIFAVVCGPRKLTVVAQIVERSFVFTQIDLSKQKTDETAMRSKFSRFSRHI